jgi:hypothetical protein
MPCGAHAFRCFVGPSFIGLGRQPLCDRSLLDFLAQRLINMSAGYGGAGIDWQRLDEIVPFLQLIASNTNMTRWHKTLKLIH